MAKFSDLVYQQSVMGDYQYPPTEEVLEDLILRLYVPVARTHRDRAGYRAEHVPAGYNYVTFWQTVHFSSAHVRTFHTVERGDESLPLVNYGEALRACQEAIGALWVGILPWHEAEAEAEVEKLRELIRNFLSKRGTFADLRKAVGVRV